MCIQKRFHLSARELHNECSASVSVEIICFEHLLQGSYEKLKLGIFLQDYLQPNASQVPTTMSLWKMITVFRSLIWNFRHMFCSPNPSNIHGQRDFVSWKNTFLWFKKRDFYFWWEIQVNSSGKYVKFFSSGYCFSLYISPLNLINLNLLFTIVTRRSFQVDKPRIFFCMKFWRQNYVILNLNGAC